MKMALIISFCLSFVNVVARAQTPGPEGPVVVRSESVTTPASPQLSEPLRAKISETPVVLLINE